MDNPFGEFLNEAESEFGKIPQELSLHEDNALLTNLVTISEERAFLFDIVHRVAGLRFAFDRMRTLYELYPERPDFREHKYYACEARVLATFAYYELSTLAHLLRDQFQPLKDSHLEYLTGVRNKVLAHPGRCSFVKNSRTGLRIGPILHPELIGANSWFPPIRNHYRQKLTDMGRQLSDEDGTKAIVGLIRSGKRVEHLRPEDLLAFKSFFIPEPDLVESAKEMAALLERRCSKRSCYGL